LDYILGLDVGGTKTTVQIADCNGKVLAENESRAGNYKSVGNAKRNINEAVLGAIEKLKASEKIFFKSSCFGLAGNDSCEDANIYRKIIFNNKIKECLNPTALLYVMTQG